MILTGIKTMALSTSNSRSGVNMGSSAGYTGYPGPHPSGGVPGLGIPPPVPNLSDYRNAPHQPHLMSHPLHSLPTPQPQPLGMSCYQMIFPDLS